MPLYSYVAIGPNGREFRGQESAVSEAALEGRLRTAGNWLARADEVHPSLIRKVAGMSTFGGSVPRRALTEFFLQLSLQLRAGIPLLTALSNEAGESGHPALRRTVWDLAERVQSGQTLSEAAALHPKVFSPLIVNLLRAGEASGKLAEIANEVRLHLEWQERLFADVRQALTYPLFVLGCALVFVFVVFTFLVPRFAKLLTELNVPLPVLTQCVLATSNFFVHHWALLLSLAAGVFLAFKFALKGSAHFALLWDQFKLRVPVIGGLLRMIVLSRFSQNLAVMYHAGIPLLESLQLVKGLLGNRVLERSVGELRKAVNEGRQMHSAMNTHSIFSKLVTQMVAVGETTGSLGTALENVSSYYNEVLPRQIKRMFSLLEPLMIVGLIGFVGLIALSIFLPIVSLINVR